jgi:hypothetical protein
MIKVVSIFSLPEGTDQDKFWKFHTVDHVKDVLKVARPSLKKYVINRVVKVNNGETKIFGIVEQWWESEEALKDYLKHCQLLKPASGKTPQQDFQSRIAPGSFSVMVEEKEIPV